MGFISIVTHNNNGRLVRPKLGNSSGFILIYGEELNLVKAEHDYPFNDEYGPYRKMENGYYQKMNVEKYKKRHGAHNIYYTKDGRFRGIKVRPETEHREFAAMHSVWTDAAPESYPTEKPFKLLERIICLSTK